MTLTSEVNRLRLFLDICGLARLRVPVGAYPVTAIWYHKSAMPCCLKRGRTILPRLQKNYVCSKMMSTISKSQSCESKSNSIAGSRGSSMILLASSRGACVLQSTDRAPIWGSIMLVPDSELFSAGCAGAGFGSREPHVIGCCHVAMFEAVELPST